MKINSLGYVVVESTDAKKWQHYATEVCGLMMSPTMPDNGHLYFKMDQRPFRYMVVEGDRDGLYASGWQLEDKTAFDAALSELDAKDISYERLTAAELTERAVSDAVRLDDPAGNILEIYWHDAALADDGVPFKSPLDVQAFITQAQNGADMGLGHVVLYAAKDFEKTHQFYCDLGFMDSDITDLSAQHMGKIYFMNCNPRHHSLALWNWGAPTPATDFKPSSESQAPGCVHLMMEVGSLAEVGSCLDRVHENEVMVTSTLGEHINDEMTSFYMLSPGNFAIEFGFDGNQLDTSHTTTHNTLASKWGHKWTG